MAYSSRVNLKTMKTAAAVIWVLAVGAVGLLTDVNSLSSWLVVVACAIIPPLVMMRLWNPPDQTMSQSIQRELR